MDNVAYNLPDFAGARVFVTEFLPGQFGQRIDSAVECIQLISQGECPIVRSAKPYALGGDLADVGMDTIKHYVINPIKVREASLETKGILKTQVPVPGKVEIVADFSEMDVKTGQKLIDKRGLTMDLADLEFCQKYFSEEGHGSTITEVRVIDTYWSDYCHYITFGIELDKATIDDVTAKTAFEHYLTMRHELGRDAKPVCLMNMGTIGTKWLKGNDVPTGFDGSEEINACTVKVKVDVDGHDEGWLSLFKDETHSHFTRIKPFDGATTCIGGCIRDPLSGHSYVYQAARVIDAVNPTVPASETLEGRLLQHKLVTTAAVSYSSYSNQIGLVTGQVDEIYHPGYVTKRMEVGAIIAATLADHMRRETPAPGDKIILLGSRTDRDNIGGAAGSSETHNVESFELDGAEMQEGNALVKCKLRYLSRHNDACRLIKRYNDLGAGGVSVVVGELVDGPFVDLDTIPKKHEGLDGTKLAISEPRGRMAMGVAAEDVGELLAYAREENPEATVITTATEDPRMAMTWNGDKIVNPSRGFLTSDGASKHQTMHVEERQFYETLWGEGTLAEHMNKLVIDINVTSNKGFSERFDPTTGAGTALMPLGDECQLAPNMVMVVKLPVLGETTTASAMARGSNSYIMPKNQFTGAYLPVVELLAKLVTVSSEYEKAYLSFQEYFEKSRDEPERWGKPAAVVLGTLMAQVNLGAGTISGRDSMSDSLRDLDAPPTLISSAVIVGNMKRVTSPEFKDADHRIVCIVPRYLTDDLAPDKDALPEVFLMTEELADFHDTLAVSTSGHGTTVEALFKVMLGNRIGTTPNNSTTVNDLFALAYGSFIVELSNDAKLPAVSSLAEIGGVGTTASEHVFKAAGETLDLNAVQEAQESDIKSVFPYRSKGEGKGVAVGTIDFRVLKKTMYIDSPVIKSHMVIPVFPGNDCECDPAAAFERVGADVTILIVNNLTPAAVAGSTQALVDEVNKSRVMMTPGGLSGGDESDGFAKFIITFFRAPAVTEAVRDLLKSRDDLMFSIRNGFQAFVKPGLVSYGDIVPMIDACPALTSSTIGRHQNRLVRTRVASDLSPWLSKTSVGDIYTVAISYGENRFVASDEVLAQPRANGQIAAQYVDETGIPGMDLGANLNGSLLAIKGITNSNSHVLGKMDHSERSSSGLYVNVPGNKHQPTFETGVEYFVTR